MRCQAQSADNTADAVDAGSSLSRRSVFSAAAALAPAVGVLSSAFPAVANTVLSSEWESIELPIDPQIVLLDLAMLEDGKRGFIVGTRQTLLETTDGGKSWVKREVPALAEEGFNYRFNSINFNGEEGWIVGKPAVMLRTTDGGKTWDRVPLSNKLPGIPLKIFATGPKSAEMVTDQGAIYVSSNEGYTWQAGVQETVDATLNRTVSSGITGASYYEGTFSCVNRNPSSGDYVAVSSRGNFFMTWSPGDTYWMPHNRPVPRRIQSMGYDPAGKLFLTTRGGDVFIGSEAGITDKFDQARLGSRGFGVLDIGFRPDSQDAYACGGSGTLYKSADGGKSFKRDKTADQVPANFYEVKWFGPKTGFVLGNNASLLRYIA